MIAAILFVAHKAKAVGAEHRARVNDNAPSKRRTRIDDNSWVEVAVVADHNAFANAAARSDVRALADNRVSLDHRVGINADAVRASFADGWITAVG